MLLSPDVEYKSHCLYSAPELKKENAHRERLELQVKFYLGQSENYSLGDSTSDSTSETAPKRPQREVNGVRAIKHVFFAGGFC